MENATGGCACKYLSSDSFADVPFVGNSGENIVDRAFADKVCDKGPDKAWTRRW